MAAANIKAAVERVESVLTRRPDLGMHADTSAVARWQQDLRVIAHHPDGTQLATDMPPELGGSGAALTPGWLMRAGLATCTATSIALAAAAQGLELEMLEVTASSRSDARGILGMNDGEHGRVAAGPHDVELSVRLSARGARPERLRQLVEETRRRTPVWCALEDSVPVVLRVEVPQP